MRRRRVARGVAEPAPLAFIDEHERTLAVPPERAWGALARALPRAVGGGILQGYARVVGCDPARADGVFPREGSALPGFRVARVLPPRELLLAGSHRFARYELDLRLEPLDHARRTRLVARTRAAFPGAGGAAYRLAVIGSGAHAWSVRRLLAHVERRAARPGDPSAARG